MIADSSKLNKLRNVYAIRSSRIIVVAFNQLFISVIIIITIIAVVVVVVVVCCCF